MNPIWNEKFIDEISPSDVHSMVSETISDVSNYKRRGLIKVIKRVFNLAIEEGVLVRNPAVGIRVKTSDSNESVLNKNEIAILLKEAKSVQHRFYPHWALAILTGMRSGGLHSLRWKNIDLTTGFINITKAWTRYNGEGPTKTGKNLTSLRSKILQNLLENCTSIKVKRLFLHLADKVHHPWVKKIDLNRISLGKGKRLIYKNGMLDSKYQITIPKEAFYEKS